MTMDYQSYVDNLMTDGRAISQQSAGDGASTRLNSVDALANLNSQDIKAILDLYNKQNDADRLPDVTFSRDQDGLLISFSDPEVPTTVMAHNPREKQIGKIGKI